MVAGADTDRHPGDPVASPGLYAVSAVPPGRERCVVRLVRVAGRSAGCLFSGCSPSRPTCRLPSGRAPRLSRPAPRPAASRGRATGETPSMPASGVVVSPSSQASTGPAPRNVPSLSSSARTADALRSPARRHRAGTRSQGWENSGSRAERATIAASHGESRSFTPETLARVRVARAGHTHLPLKAHGPTPTQANRSACPAARTGCRRALSRPHLANVPYLLHAALGPATPSQAPPHLPPAVTARRRWRRPGRPRRAGRSAPHASTRAPSWP
jgi:hypothetical protein